MRPSCTLIAMTPSTSPSRRTRRAGPPLTTAGSVVNVPADFPMPPGEHTGHPPGAGDRPQRGVLDAAAVAQQDDLGGEHLKERPRIPGFDGAPERPQDRRALVRGDRPAGAPGVDVPTGVVGDLADHCGVLPTAPAISSAGSRPSRPRIRHRSRPHACSQSQGLLGFQVFGLKTPRRRLL